MRDGVRKRIWVAALAALAALGFVRGQITGGSGDGSLFLPFSGVVDYVGDGLMGTASGSDPYGYTQPPPPDPVRADCVRLGIPTSLRVNQVGTTTSPFCPGVAGVWANAGGDWTVSLQGGPAGQQVTTTAQVWSTQNTTVRVDYTYNPPQGPPQPDPARIYRFDPDTGRYVLVEEYLGGDPFGYWATNYDPQTTVLCTSGQNGCP